MQERKWNEVSEDELQELIKKTIQAATSRTFKTDDERIDYVFDNYTFPAPKDGNAAEWRAFYGSETSPFRRYHDAVWDAIYAQEEETQRC